MSKVTTLEQTKVSELCGMIQKADLTKKDIGMISLSWNQLTTVTQTEFRNAAMFCVQFHLGDQKVANFIISNCTLFGSKIAWFFSKSKMDDLVLAGDPNWRQYISNFQDLPNGFRWDNKLFPNLEHAFHYEKFKRTNRPSLGNIYVGLKSKFKSASKAKAFSGKKSMKDNRTKLDVLEWDKDRIIVSQKMLRKRLAQDEHFLKILQDADRNRIILYHFERGSRKRPPFWGSLKMKDSGEIIGTNMLGRQLTQLLHN